MSLRITPIKGLRSLTWEAFNCLLSSFLKIQVSLPNCSADLSTVLCNPSKLSVFVVPEVSFYDSIKVVLFA
jgi:hypothetical protein